MDAGIELNRVHAELRDIEAQLELLLERQQQLIDKEKQLQKIIKEEAEAANKDADKTWDKNDFPWSKELIEKCESVFKIHTFRPLQLQTMNTTLSGRDCVLVMPTGGGKSLCFQLPAMVSNGITLVVSPLVSLMEDQLYGLQKLLVPAKLLNASSSKADVNLVHNAMTDHKSDLKLLYVTPEKLAKSKRFMNKLEKMYEIGRFSRLVIDEIHCCSQWGHDFRPDYKFLGIMKKQFPRVPILGLTATATSSVLNDVKKILGIQGCVVYRASFNRHNLYYEVKLKPSAFKVCMDDIQKVITTRFKGQSGIVYCVYQKESEEVASELTKRGIKSACYHANLNAGYRSQVHTAWLENKVQVVVATIAFGMGIDKPDVRFVIHHSISKSMENYYQESGRAGRDDGQSSCLLYAGFQDVFKQSTMVFTEQTGLEKLYNIVSYAFNLNLCRRSLIACHFGEKWDESDCKQMCDHCNPSQQEITLTKDVTSHCRDVIAALLKHKGKTRLTGLKLLDAWLGKGKKSPVSREDGERILVHMLLEGYLKEDFHFTPYSTISYLLPGPREQQLSRNDHKVEIPLRTPLSRKPSDTTTKTTNQNSTATRSTLTSKNVKRVPCVVNTQKSIVSDCSFLAADPVAANNDCSKKITKVRKRKPVVVSSDEDFDDILPKRLKANGGMTVVNGVNHVNQQAGDGGSCIVLGGDSSDVDDC